MVLVPRPADVACLSGLWAGLSAGGLNVNAYDWMEAAKAANHKIFAGHSMWKCVRTRGRAWKRRTRSHIKVPHVASHTCHGMLAIIGADVSSSNFGVYFRKDFLVRQEIPESVVAVPECDGRDGELIRTCDKSFLLELG